MVQGFNCVQMRALLRLSLLRVSGCQGAMVITNLSWVQERKLRICQQAETKSRPGGTKTLSDWRQPGRRDKQLTFIVRVSLCFIFSKINVIHCPEVLYKSAFEIKNFLYDIDRKCHEKCLGVAWKNQWSFAGDIIISHLLF